MEKINNYNVVDMLSFTENIDNSKLKFLYNQFDIVCDEISFKNPVNYQQVIDKQTKKTLLRNRLKNTDNIFTYKSKHHMRLTSQGYSLQGMCKDIRHFLSKDTNYDVDIVMCHPVILKWWSDINNIPNSQFTEFIENKDEIYNLYMAYNEKNEEDTKKYFLSLINDECKKIHPDDYEFNLYIEIRNFQDRVAEQRKDLLKRAKDKCFKENKKNVKGVCMSMFLQEIENKILQCMLKYNRDNDINVSAPCYDGFLVYKSDIEHKKNEYLVDLEKYVFDELGIKIKLKYKNMTQGQKLEMLYEKHKNDIPAVKYDYTEYENYIESQDIDYDNFNEFNKFVGKYSSLEQIKKLFHNTIFHCQNAGNKSFFITKTKEFDVMLKNYYYKNNLYNADILSDKKSILLKNTTLKNNDEIQKYLGLKRTENQYITIELYDVLKMMYKNNQIKFYESIIFKPYFLKEPEYCVNKFNLFQKFSLLNDNEYFENKKSTFDTTLFYKHIKETLCNNDERIFDYILNFIAHMIQKPDEKPTHFILFLSKQGIGKDTLFRLIKKMLGLDRVIIYEDPSQFFADFNKDQEGLLLTVLNELSEEKYSSQIKHQNELKGRITAEKLKVQPKFVDKYYIDDYSRFMGTSNFSNPLNIEASDRRYVVINCNNDILEWDEKVRESYFLQMYKDLNDIDFLKNAFSFFALRDISNFNVNKEFETKGKSDMKENCMNNVYQFIVDMFSEYDLDDNFRIHTQDLYELYKIYCKDVGTTTTVQRKTFTKRLDDLKLKDKRIRILKGNNCLPHPYNVLYRKFQMTVDISKIREGYEISRQHLETLFQNHLKIPHYTIKSKSETITEFEKEIPQNDNYEKILIF